MRVTLLGHASLVVQAPDACVFVDPVFSDPFQGDLVVSCPRREVDVDALPRPDAVILSHGHLDHFHPPSLRRMDRRTPVFCPPDRALAKALALEGFSDVTMLTDASLRRVGALEWRPTPSDGPAVEMGIMFRSQEGTVWNVVDTVVTQRIVVEALEWLDGELDVAFCAYRPLLEHASMWVDESGFPRERYERLLEMAICTRARTVIPGSAGLRAADHHGWLNHRIFPVSREEFVRDLNAVAPELRTQLLNPGEALVLRKGADPVVEDSRWARTVELDEDRVAFDPEGHPAPPLVDENSHRYREPVMRDAITTLMEEHFPRAMRNTLTWRTTGPLRTLWDRRAALQVDVVFPSTTESWHVAQWSPFTLERGAHPDADYTFQYVASQIHGYARGNWRQTPRVVARRRRGIAKGAFRFSALDPARLHDVDQYLVVDETFEWNPLALLA
ncbi:MAG: MBL fold metallo-hydrolase [Myxococcota bacterium]